MNTNYQTIHQMGTAVSEMVRQATGRNPVQSMDMDWVSVEQLAKYIYGIDTGDIVSFDTNITDGIDMLIAYIQYVQDLHGYDNPWPVGGSKNIILKVIENANVNASGEIVSNNDYDLYVAKVVSETTYIFSSNGSAADTIGVVAYYDDEPSIGSVSYDGDRSTSVANPFTATNSKYVVLRIAANSEKCQLEEGSSATSYIPYSNVCPITGWTGCNVTRSNKNVWDSNWSIDGTATYKKDGLLTVKTTTVGVTALLGADGDPVNKTLKAGTYTLSSSSDTFNGIYALLHDGTQWTNGQTKTFAADVVIDQIKCTYKELITGTYYWKLQIEVGSTASSYEAHQGTTYPITWQTEAGTVYGGYIDLITGILTVTHKSITFTGAEDEDWVAASQNQVAQFHITVDDAYSIAGTRTPVGCNIGYYVATGYQPLACSMIYVGISRTSELYYSPPIPYNSNVSTFKTWLASNNLQVVYKLAEPETYQLDPQDVTALIGSNVIFADTGEVSVKYKHKEDVP